MLVLYDDPIIFYIIRSKRVAASVLVGDFINLEEELCNYVVLVPVQSVEVETVHATKPTEKQREDHQSKDYFDMHIVGPWNDVVTNLDYTQDSQLWCGGRSSNSEVVSNPNIAHDLEILQQHRIMMT